MSISSPDYPSSFPVYYFYSQEMELLWLVVYILHVLLLGCSDDPSEPCSEDNDVSSEVHVSERAEDATSYWW